MNDTIRKAVELADDWEIHGLNGFSTPDSGHDAALDSIDEMSQFEKDALAAQLVRQVDALGGKFMLITSPNEVHIGDEVLAAIANEQGPDRTMNTIKAIIDSGVLDEKGQNHG